MKKGDIIVHDKLMPKGTVLFRGAESGAEVTKWMEQSCTDTYGQNLPFKVSGDDQNVGRFMAELLMDYKLKEQAKVNWIIEGEISITLYTGGMKFIGLEDGWTVFQSAIPSYQSQVENMNEDELRTALDEFRTERSTVRVKSPGVRKSKVAKAPVDPMEKVLAKLDPEKKARLMKKLGMID